jgi:hypothetical protein
MGNFGAATGSLRAVRQDDDKKELEARKNAHEMRERRRS